MSCNRAAVQRSAERLRLEQRGSPRRKPSSQLTSWRNRRLEIDQLLVQTFHLPPSIGVPHPRAVLPVVQLFPKLRFELLILPILPFVFSLLVTAHHLASSHYYRSLAFTFISSVCCIANTNAWGGRTAGSLSPEDGRNSGRRLGGYSPEFDLGHRPQALLLLFRQ